MIVWIDGANGVGKSHVADALAKRLTNRNAEYVESDLYWMDFIQNEHKKSFLDLIHTAIDTFFADSGKY